MKKLLLGVSAVLLGVSTVTAQDIHHTQYFASPLTLNPALTGLTKYDVRAAVNYRSQWYSVSSNPYMTAVGSVDIATLKGKLPEGDALGVGLVVAYDKSGTGALQNTTVGLSAAYHKAFGYEKQHTLSLGVQGLLVQKSIDFNSLRFEDQLNPQTGNIDRPTGENFPNKDLSYPDFATGLMYSGRISEHSTAYAGVGYHHITRPVEQFLSGGQEHKLHSRINAYMGGSFDLNENTVMYASAQYQTQAGATSVMLGAAAGFVLNPGHDPEYRTNTVFYLGAWYRYGDAICPYIGLEWTKMTLGISYDVNVSSFTAATGTQGAYEISLVFNGKINKRDAQQRYNFSCPKF